MTAYGTAVTIKGTTYYYIIDTKAQVRELLLGATAPIDLDIRLVAATNKDVQLNMRTLAKSIKILNAVDDLEDARRMIVQQCSYE